MFKKNTNIDKTKDGFMGRKKKSAFAKNLLSLLISVPTLFSIVGKMVSLFKFETRLAGRSLVCLIILIILVALLLTTTWICFISMIFVYLVSLHWSIMQTLLILMCLNILLLVFVIFSIRKFKKRLLFPATRRRIKDAYGIYENLMK